MREWTLKILLIVIFFAYSPKARAEPFAYISSLFGNTVSVVDTATNTVVATVPVGGGPKGVAVTPDGKRVYVANQGSGTVSVIDTTTNSKIATVFVGGAPNGIAVHPSGKRVYVTNNALTVIETITNTVVTAIYVGSTPRGVAVHPDGTKVYVTASCCTDGIFVVDTTTNQLVDVVSFPVQSFLNGIVLTPDGRQIYVAAEAGVVRSHDPGVYVVNTVTKHISMVKAVFQPYALAVHPDGKRVYATSLDKVWVINTATNGVITRIKIPGAIALGNSQGIAVHPDGTKVYVTSIDANTVSVINTVNNRITATIPVANGPVAYGRFIGPSCVSLDGSTPNPTVKQPRPICLGAAGGNVTDKITVNGKIGCVLGTLGSLVTDENSFFILSNNHVLAKNNEAKIGSDIAQPNTCQKPGNNIVADLVAFKSINFNFSAPNTVDAAIAEIRTGAVDANGSILGIGPPNTIPMLPADALGREVKKYGAATGVTHGIVTAINQNFDVTSKNTGKTAKFTNQIRITGLGGPFSADGDSGALVVEDVPSCPRPVGLLYGGDETSTFINPIIDVLGSLGVRIAGCY
ncbi:MAG: YncE family protein [Deltaproteobacteria bacterium]|nr:YncE family protein [Deltaproteobacteria bacterium]